MKRREFLRRLSQYLLSLIDILGIEGWVLKTNISIEIKAALWDNWLVINADHSKVINMITWSPGRGGGGRIELLDTFHPMRKEIAKFPFFYESFPFMK